VTDSEPTISSAPSGPPGHDGLPRARGRRAPVIIGCVVIAAVVAVGVWLLSIRSGASTERWGQNDPVKLAARLHVCNNAQRFNTSAACVTPGGDRVAVSVSESEAVQQFTVAMIEDHQPDACSIVATGWIVSAASRSALAGSVGIPEAFAKKHHAYILCHQ
jgi:hypothetical protein